MNNDPRLQQLKRWLSDVLHSDDFQIKPASADASFRRYFRVSYQQQSRIVMDAPPDKEDCRPFINIARLIEQSAVHAPHIYEADVEQGFMLLSDLGSTAYLDKLNTETVGSLYTDALNALHKMQTIQADLPLYDDALLQTEMDLFNDWFLKRHLNIQINSQESSQLQKLFNHLIQSAKEQTQVFVHRDYHSRNLMITDDNNPGVIDFQDAVIGPISYDLVSLLKDCYISWPGQTQLQFVEMFYQQNKSQIHTDLNTFIKHYDLMGLQRHIKVAGIFCRLNYRDGKSHYLNDLPLVLAYIVDVCQRYPETRVLLDLFQSWNIQADSSLLEALQ